MKKICRDLPRRTFDKYISLQSLESAPNELPDFLVFARVFALSSFLTISPVLMWSALFIIHHFLSIWQAKITSYRKKARFCSSLLWHFNDKMWTPAKYNDTYLLSQGWREMEKYNSMGGHLNDRRHNYEQRGKGFLFNDRLNS